MTAPPAGLIHPRFESIKPLTGLEWLVASKLLQSHPWEGAAYAEAVRCVSPVDCETKTEIPGVYSQMSECQNGNSG
jgi:hypothetical protein